MLDVPLAPRNRINDNHRRENTAPDAPNLHQIRIGAAKEVIVQAVDNDPDHQRHAGENLVEQQPAVLERTLKQEAPRIARFADSLKKRGTRLIVLVARGSSDNAALFGRYLLEIKPGFPSRFQRHRSTHFIRRSLI